MQSWFDLLFKMFHSATFNENVKFIYFLREVFLQLQGRGRGLQNSGDVIRTLISLKTQIFLGEHFNASELRRGKPLRSIENTAKYLCGWLKVLLFHCCKIQNIDNEKSNTHIKGETKCYYSQIMYILHVKFVNYIEDTRTYSIFL